MDTVCIGLKEICIGLEKKTATGSPDWGSGLTGNMLTIYFFYVNLGPLWQTAYTATVTEHQNLNEPIRKKHLTQDLTSWSHHNNNRWDVNCFDFILVWWCIQEPKERKKEDMAHKDNYYNMIKWWTDKHQFRQECMEGYWWRGHTARELAWRRLRVQHVRLGLTGHEDATSFSPTEVPPGISAWLTRPLGYLGYPCPTKWDLSVAAYPIHSYKFMEGDKVSLGS